MEGKQKTKNMSPINCKVILVGDTGVGKTCIIQRYLNKYNPNVKTTINTSFYSKLEIIDNYKINFQIWDTVGQERYRSMNSLFFKDAHMCILVYDITREESFNNIKDYWYESAITNGLEGIIFGIAANKNDLYEYEKVDKDEVKDFCQQINSILCFTSAKDNCRTDELFKELGIKFINSDFMKEIREKNIEKKEEVEKIKLNENKKEAKKNGKKGCC